MKPTKKQRMRQAVVIMKEWLLAPKDEPHPVASEGCCPYDEALRPLRLSMRLQQKAMMIAITDLMQRGYVIRDKEGWPQAFTLDDMSPAHREEIIRRRADGIPGTIRFYTPEDPEARSC